MSLKQVLTQQFGSIDNDLLDDFVNTWSDSFTIKRNEKLIRFNTIENNIYFIEEGTCCITYPDMDEDIVIGFGYPNTFLFSPSILNGETSQQEVIMIKKTVLKSIHKSDFFAFINSNERIKAKWHRLIEQLLLAQIDRQTDLLISSPEERLKRLLKRSPHVFQLIPQKYIASYLRMKPETLSRIQKP